MYAPHLQPGGTVPIPCGSGFLEPERAQPGSVLYRLRLAREVIELLWADQVERYARIVSAVESAGPDGPNPALIRELEELVGCPASRSE